MASPQVEKGHIRIANELYDEILRRNFSKRQQNLVLFIWRLSYGTGRTDCEIKQFNLFELVGIYRSDIRKELNNLRECEVLDWDAKTMIFSINKNYKLWQVTPNKNWDSDKFNELIHQNIKRKSVSESLTNDDKRISEIPTIQPNEVSETPTSEKPKVSKTLTFVSKRVSKSLTMELVKHQQRLPLNLDRARRTESLYPLLKTLKIKDIKDNNNRNPFTFFENNISPLSPYAINQLTDWSEMLPDDVLIFSMELAVEANKRSLGYVNTVLTNWKNEGVKNINDAKRSNQEFRNRFVKNNRFNQSKVEVVPDWFEKRQQSETAKPKEDVNKAELAALLQKHASDGG